ncbi:hypothetical protein BC939DRAFT_498303 [Gamsiella multidivaricata]|uniref:uncharacterized protein n=1 Tax=Gamsiella multidivaricata TaxID=101098 RepID=UPI00221F6BBA|nr:uncharacterized protein BC939DRAFT_498303 [Gamsiella multidivaricata]KAI7832209.1 hypothetical protein BC939DRAFT_498303 [Gamsiella multidivaricata]
MSGEIYYFLQQSFEHQSLDGSREAPSNSDSDDDLEDEEPDFMDELVPSSSFSSLAIIPYVRVTRLGHNGIEVASSSIGIASTPPAFKLLYFGRGYIVAASAYPMLTVAILVIKGVSLTQDEIDFN